MSASDRLPSPLPLRQLAPTPLYDDDDEDDTANSKPSTTRRPSSPRTSKLGTLASLLSTTHKLSAYPFTLFLTTHFLSTGLVPFLTRDVDSSNSALLFARELYQANTTIEAVLIPISISTHVLSGLGLRATRYIQDKRRYGEGQFFRGMSWVSISGYCLLPIVAEHALRNRAWPLLVDGDTSGIGVDYVGHGFLVGGKIMYWASWAWYAALIGGAAYHLGFGWNRFLKLSTKRPRRVLAGIAASVAAVWAGGLGVIASNGRVRGIAGNHYDELHRSLFQALRLN